VIRSSELERGSVMEESIKISMSDDVADGPGGQSVSKRLCRFWDDFCDRGIEHAVRFIYPLQFLSTDERALADYMIRRVRTPYSILLDPMFIVYMSEHSSGQFTWRPFDGARKKGKKLELEMIFECDVVMIAIILQELAVQVYSLNCRYAPPKDVEKSLVAMARESLYRRNAKAAIDGEVLACMEAETPLLRIAHSGPRMVLFFANREIKNALEMNHYFEWLRSEKWVF